MQTLFISDLHLDAGDTGKLALLQALLRAAPGRAQALYILGDLFERWLGEDERDEVGEAVFAGLRQAAQAGLQVFFMRGNRDFLMGRGVFQARSGCRLLPDPSVVELPAGRALLTHGDRLCTGDVAYQWYRRLVNHAPGRLLIPRLPLGWRRQVAHWLRAQSGRSNRLPVDVTPWAVEHWLARHRVYLMIHGHTHRQASHRLQRNGETAWRYVLGDWSPTEGSVLVCDDGGKLAFMAASRYVHKPYS